jgi:hypothetical protein
MRLTSILKPRRPLSTAAASIVALAASMSPRLAEAAPVVIDGDVPQGGPDHFFLDFDVPAGTKEIEIRHDDKSDANILDWGVVDPDGYRGWGGGTTEPAIIGELASSRAYVSGPIKPGKWRVVVGKAKVVASPAQYHVEIDLRTAPTLPPATDRRPYAAAPARKTGTRYYAGDFHVHDRESTDAAATIQDDIALAKRRGLDFIELSDHNTITQDDLIGAIQDKEPDLLLIPGIEYTTYAGHANAIGATKWVDHKIGQPGVTIDRAVDEIVGQGAIFSINHPKLDIGDLCIGCAWKHEIDPMKLGGVEIATLGLKEGGQIFSALAIAFWDGFLDKGAHVAALGGSDDHRAGTDKGSFPARIGSPTTLVRATELSAPAILAGVKKGATVVKLQGPEDAMVELEAATKKGGDAIGWPGDTIGARSIVLRVKVTGGDGHQLRLVKNGKPVDPVIDVKGDPFVYETIVEAPASGEERYRAEWLTDEKPHTVTSHIWVKLDPNGPTVEEPAPPPSGGGDDGGCTTTPRSSPAAPLVLAGLGLLGGALVRRRRR